MTRRIFKSIVMVALGVMLASIVLIMSILYDYFSNESSRMLKNDASNIAAAVNMAGADYLRGLKSEDDRITLIESDGTVIYDNTADASRMNNHSDREEVIEALETGVGESERYSATISEKTSYYAVKLDDGSVLRLASTRITALSLLLAMLQPIFAVVILTVVVSIILASKVSKLIVEPVNKINLDSPIESEVYEELQPLLRRITEQNKQIDRQIKELSEGDKRRREFTANVSHELKTPLTAISGTAEIMMNGLVKSEDIPHFAGNIYNEAGRLITLVGDIIKLAQLDESSIELKKIDLNLQEAASEVLERLKTAAEKKQVALVLEGSEARVEAVPQIIDEMIYNICDNAIKYNKAGGSVTVGTGHNAMLGSYIKVTDTGIGIPAESLDRVFERFYCVDKSHSKEVGGTGLGLSIVKHGAAYHDAKITINSEVGVGTSVMLNFLK